jgi:hypothetical protein
MLISKLLRKMRKFANKQKRFFSQGDFLGFVSTQFSTVHCFICRPSDSTVPEDVGIEPRTVATSALAVRRSNLSLNFIDKKFIQKKRAHNWSLSSSILTAWQITFSVCTFSNYFHGVKFCAFWILVCKKK